MKMAILLGSKMKIRLVSKMTSFLKVTLLEKENLIGPFSRTKTIMMVTRTIREVTLLNSPNLIGPFSKAGTMIPLMKLSAKCPDTIGQFHYVHCRRKLAKEIVIIILWTN